MTVVVWVIVSIPLVIAWQLLIGAGVGKWSDQSGDYSVDSYATYDLGGIVATTPGELLKQPDRYAKKLVRIDHINARTLIVDSHLGGLQGSLQFTAYTATQPTDQVLLVDVNSYVTPDCTSTYVGCPRFLGARMEVEQIGAVAQYDKIEGRWLPINRYHIPLLSKQPAYPYALWVAQVWAPGALAPR
jgi:hypothetical protein